MELNDKEATQLKILLKACYEAIRQTLEGNTEGKGLHPNTYDRLVDCQGKLETFHDDVLKPHIYADAAKIAKTVARCLTPFVEDDMPMMQQMHEEHQKWLDLVELLLQADAVTKEDCQTTVMYSDKTLGTKIFAAIRAWGSELVTLRLMQQKPNYSDARAGLLEKRKHAKALAACGFIKECFDSCRAIKKQGIVYAEALHPDADGDEDHRTLYHMLQEAIAQAATKG